MDRSRVAIVIPALNESATISSVVKLAADYGCPIVVDDGSVDNTADLALSGGAIVISHKFNLGYDHALNSGFKKASELDFEIVVTVDADGQHDVSLIKKFIDAIDGEVDIVLGVRSRKQRFSETLFAWYTNWFYGIRDPLCGMKAYRIDVYKDLGHFDSYRSIGTELMIFAANQGRQVRQLDFEVRKRSGGEPRFGKVFNGNYKILRALIFAALRS